ncbi:MAG: hypothetical protein WA763_07855, partial [Pseudolabrys sp.]
LCGLEIDHKFVRGRLHNRQIGGLLAFENSPDVYTDVAIRFAATFMLFSQVDSVTKQSSAAFSDESPLDARYPGRNFKFTVRKKP